MAEIDITNKVKFCIKYGLVGVLSLIFICSSVVWYVLYTWGNINIYDAKIASSMVGVRARAPGKVTEVLVHDGDVVKAGDVIASVQVAVTDEQLKQMQQTLELSQKNLEQIKKGVVVSRPRMVQSSVAGASEAEIANAKKKLDQMNSLYEMGAISGIQRDEAKAQYESLLANKSRQTTDISYEATYQPPNQEAVKMAQQQVNQARAALEAAKTNAGATEITASVDGVVYLNGIEAGTEINPGDVVAYVGDDSDIWVEAYLDKTEADYVDIGRLASFYVDRKKYDGTIFEIIEPEDHGQPDENTEGKYDSIYPEGKLIVKIAVPREIKSDIHIGNPVDVRFSKS
ncbi:MAG: HlyD family efflux transporter periplasmic adaptor subunit [Anaerovibrio sp.]|uniref:HlyD family secretion protein n=1 Tax=Anaerovibrio sp. TaxID=1872532 RepID=UPI0025D6ED70|nr:HlyD family efflux transporter periplasmic adaptor subunit [Anaerovibrio sp.]MCR5175811.1 HlyD family efflux transporter periplasmic adaptor subunit [Anaerovibrio sp.]